MNITFEEAAFGVKREITIARHEACDVCHGSGAKPGTKPVTCDKCGGKGKVQTTQNTIMGTFSTVKVCDKCNGEGKVIPTPCDKCNGKGNVKKTKKIQVDVPAGIDNGQAISYRGEGDIGKKGGPNGDLFVVVNVAKHKIFTRRGFDILCELSVPFTKLTLGGTISVPTLEGNVEFNIPEGTQSGTVFKLKDKGIQNINSKSKGNLEFTVNVEIPKRLNDKQREILKEFANNMGEEVNVKKRNFFGR